MEDRAAQFGSKIASLEMFAAISGDMKKLAPRGGNENESPKLTIAAPSRTETHPSNLPSPCSWPRSHEVLLSAPKGSIHVCGKWSDEREGNVSVLERKWSSAPIHAPTRMSRSG